MSNLTVDHIYPLTIFHTRYNGGYEGGVYVALKERYENIPLEATGSDVDCAQFWFSYDKPYGAGRTPDEAAQDLLNKMLLGGWEGDI